jgi:hypothetical protein
MQKWFTWMQKQFAAIDNRFTSIESQMDKGFAAVADDIAHTATRHDQTTTEKRLNNRLDGVKGKWTGCRTNAMRKLCNVRIKRFPSVLRSLNKRSLARSRTANIP